MDDVPQHPQRGVARSAPLGLRGATPLSRSVRERLASDPLWAHSAQNGKWVCPYCLGAVAKRAGRSREESIALHLESCRGWQGGRGAPQALNQIAERVYFEDMTWQAETNPVWRVYDHDGVWFCPSCLGRIGAVRLVGGQLNNFVFQAMAGHLRQCQAYVQGRIHPVEQVQLARDRAAHAPALAAQVGSQLQLPVWRYSTREGAWVCPCCLAAVPGVRLGSAADLTTAVEAITAHLLSACPVFDPSHGLATQPEATVRQAAGGRTPLAGLSTPTPSGASRLLPPTSDSIPQPRGTPSSGTRVASSGNRPPIARPVGAPPASLTPMPSVDATPRTSAVQQLPPPELPPAPSAAPRGKSDRTITQFFRSVEDASAVDPSDHHDASTTSRDGADSDSLEQDNSTDQDDSLERDDITDQDDSLEQDNSSDDDGLTKSNLRREHAKTQTLSWMDDVQAETPADDSRFARTDVIHARSLQENLLVDAPILSGYRFATRYEACADLTGDFYEFVTLPDGRVGFALGDVSGHGVQAGLIMSMAKKVLEIYAGSGLGPAEVLAKLNDSLIRDLGGKMFISLLYGILAPDERTITWARAGHNPGMHYHLATGEVTEIKPRGMVVGMKSGFHYRQSLEEQTSTLASGDVILLYTDGITETMNLQQDEFGTERLVEVLQRHAIDGPDVLLEQIMDRIRHFRGPRPPADDATLLALIVE